jgi:hypothetical protein
MNCENVREMSADDKDGMSGLWTLALLQMQGEEKRLSELCET